MSEAKAEAKVEAAPKPKKKMMMFIIIGVVALVVLVGGGLGAFLMLRSSEPAADEAAGEAAHAAPAKKAVKKDEKKHPPVFEKLPQFTVNLNSENGEVMQTDIVIELTDAVVAGQVKQLMPKIQSNINKLLSAKKPEEIKTSEGRDKLEGEVKVAINKIIEAEGEAGVHSVNFTTFIIR